MKREPVMRRNISRRKALTTGLTATGITSGFACSENRSVSDKSNIPYAERSWWEPGGNKDYIRNLKPGVTPVRLACMTPKTMLNYPENGSITEIPPRKH